MGSSPQPPAAAGQDKPETKRPRAPQIRNWLAFIRPHADRYAALPRGERMQLVAELSKKTGTRENTLRRFIAAAQVLETHGIREIPPGRKYLPVGSVEAIERISKKDPERGRELFKNLFEGAGSIRHFRAKLADTLGRDPPKKPSYREKRFWIDDILGEIEKRARVSRRHFQVMRFVEAPLKRSFSLFAKSAAPVLVVLMPEDRRAAVFDESVLVWSAGAAVITREFLRNIAVATAIFDKIFVLCTTLSTEVEAIAAEMPRDRRDRIVVLRGVLDLTSPDGRGRPFEDIRFRQSE
jgi:hypothetical protein